MRSLSLSFFISFVTLSFLSISTSPSTILLNQSDTENGFGQESNAGLHHPSGLDHVGRFFRKKREKKNGKKRKKKTYLMLYVGMWVSSQWVCDWQVTWLWSWSKQSISVVWIKRHLYFCMKKNKTQKLTSFQFNRVLPRPCSLQAGFLKQKKKKEKQRKKKIKKEERKIRLSRTHKTVTPSSYNDRKQVKKIPYKLEMQYEKKSWCC